MVEREMKRQKGFSLVELAIVLVIIGLLTGGILAGQSMITTAKVNAVAMQIGQFDAAVENFKTKYNYLPGDAPAFGGNGNGLIERTQTNINTNNVFDCEIASFWWSLDPVQYPGHICSNQYGMQIQSSGAAQNVPLSKLGKAGSVVVASAIATSFQHVDTNNPRNFYAILSGSAVNNTASPSYLAFTATTITNSAVTPADLLALDKKIDDGIANNGSVISGGIDCSGACGIVAGPNGAICSSGANYILTDSAYECTPLIRIGASVNDPQ